MSHVERLNASGRLGPRPVRLGRLVRWRRDELEAWVAMARRRSCTLLMDEFYSRYVYDGAGGPAAGPVSAAAFVEDVNEDPVAIVDGLTKSFRYPGWRLGWLSAWPCLR